ncbi:MAG: hypothetical protein WC758_01905 [Candidatus Woesearchaeota archaeon]|jgi:hypothetical protein
MAEILKDKTASVVETISNMVSMQNKLIVDIEKDYSSRIVSLAKGLTINKVISLFDVDSFAKDLANHLKLDVNKLKEMTAYTISSKYMEGKVLNMNLSNQNLTLNYKHMYINEFSGKAVLKLYAKVTTKTEFEIDLGQENLPF